MENPKYFPSIHSENLLSLIWIDTATTCMDNLRNPKRGKNYVVIL
jgi:hypothetical protein